MNPKKKLSIKEFSRLTGIKRENLRFYDRVGLLSPETRGENRYRYYSRRQLNIAYLISSMRGIGVGIEDIKRYSAERTPEKTLELLARQEDRFQEEIRQLQETSRIMRMYIDRIREALGHEDSTVFLQEKEREPLFLCPPIPDGMDSDEAGIFSYEYAEASGINPGFPQGIRIERSQLEAETPCFSGRYYFSVGDGGNAGKPAGLYAVAYDRCSPWNTGVLYQRLFRFIEERGLRIAGDLYEEYPLGDIVAQALDRYCIRVEVPVLPAES